ncbi:unnamed protein product [marine sediment metagenome]|uniref:HTH marR-type domain-containing protein n=1 Tax=marine sediment metagenome TaxID=412755 RepID=X1VHQ6_9ZZZZ
MAAGFNERKGQVLALLNSENDWVSCREVAEAFGISRTNAATLLRGYSNDGLTRRRKVTGAFPPYYEFMIGKAGRKKLIWLLGRSMAQAPLPGFDTEVGRPKVARRRVVKYKVIRPKLLDEDEVVRPRILREES